MIEQHIKVMESGPKEDIEIGRQGEYNVRQVVFDLSAIAEAVGPGTATIIHYPIEGAPYTVPAVAGESYDVAEQDGDTLTWTIGQLATQHKGNGVVAVTWTTADGLMKSRRFKTKCQPGIEVPDVEQAAQQSYIDQMATIAADITRSVQTAAAAVQDVNSAVQSAGQSADLAETYRDEAKTSADSAEQSAKDAEDFADLAGQHASESGYVWFEINENDGKLYVYKTENLSNVDFVINSATGKLEVHIA